MIILRKEENKQHANVILKKVGTEKINFICSIKNRLYMRKSIAITTKKAVK